MSALKSIKNIFQGSKGDSKTDIDYNMQLSKKNEKRTIRILLLGPGDSGKSTIVKQMKKIYSTLTEEDIQMMAPYIQSAVVGYIKLLCFQCEELFEKDDEKTKIEAQNEELRQQILNLNPPYELNKGLADQIGTLWADPAIKETLRLRAKYQIHDNVDYFLDKIAEIGSDAYEPNFEDYIRIRTRSTGFSMTTVCAKFDKFGEYLFEFTDVGGQRSERKKWMQIVVDQIQAVLFVIALSEYDLRCFEDNRTNRMQEALNLFTECARGNFLDGKTVLIFLNKYDLFRDKIQRIPITVAFEDYPEEKDPQNEEDVIQFIANKFMKCLEGKNLKMASPVHIHRTTALDSENIHKLFTDITLDLIKLNLTQSGMI
eukprot:212371_1